MPGNPVRAFCIIRRLLLSLLLVAAQHAAAMHALGHSVEHAHEGQPVHSLHAGCLGLHGLGDAPVTNLAAPDAVAAAPEPARDAPHCVRPAPHALPYLSRAPPPNS